MRHGTESCKLGRRDSSGFQSRDGSPSQGFLADQKLLACCLAYNVRGIFVRSVARNDCEPLTLSRPPQHNDLLAKLLACRSCESSTEEVNPDNFVAEGFSDGRKQLASANHDSEIRCLIADDVRQFRI